MRKLIRYITAAILILLGLGLFLFCLSLLPLEGSELLTAFIPGVLASVVLVFLGVCVMAGWTWRDILDFLMDLYP